jgi:hypothetical protein
MVLLPKPAQKKSVRRYSHAWRKVAAVNGLSTNDSEHFRVSTVTDSVTELTNVAEPATASGIKFTQVVPRVKFVVHQANQPV